MVSAAVRAICANYQRRERWIGADEIQQEAALVLVESARTWMPCRGPQEPYQAKAVRSRLWRHVHWLRVPVKAFTGGKQTPVHAVAVPLGDIVEAPHVSDMERALDLQRAAVHLHALMAKQTAAARAVLLQGRQSMDVARELGMSRARVYVETQAAVRALRANRRLRKLMENE
jgi:hypothetical protein